MSARHDGTTKYGPLLRHLQALPPEQASVTLPLPEVEAIIGTPLPPSARTTSFWTSGATLATALRRGGWRATLALQRDVVTLLRFPADQPRQRPLDHAAIVGAYQQGNSVTVVAQRFGLARNSVYQVLRLARIPLRGRR